MASRTSDIELYRLVARELDCTAQTARKYVDAIVEVIAKEVYLSGTCRIPNLGIFDAQHIDEKIQKQVHDGEIREYIMPEHVKPIFTPCDTFINDCNMKGVTKKYRKRAKNKQLTVRNLQRVAKAEAIERLKKVSEETKESAKIDFADKLKEKIEAHDAKKTNND